MPLFRVGDLVLVKDRLVWFGIIEEVADAPDGGYWYGIRENKPHGELFGQYRAEKLQREET
jgi:hypothetical protein